jgi:RNA polymerase subunit RPABC4/transcription elongation factor Spt4
MSAENRCPTCGALLPKPNEPCPFCAEAQRLVQQLAVEESVRLCSRCGAILQDDEESVCRKCQLQPPPSPWRRDDRIARWIRDRFVEPVAEREGIACPFCKQAVPALTAYCPHCGRKLAGVPLEAPTEETVSVAPREETVSVAPTEETASVTPPPETAAGEAVCLPSPGETELPPVEERTISGPATELSASQRALAWLRDQFRPASQVESPHVPFWRQIGGFFLSLVRPNRGGGRANTLLLAFLALLILGLVAIILFWLSMLHSGSFVFR